MVKAQAGILESDGPEQAGEKLRQAVARFVDDPASAAWLERQLRPLAGLETEEAWAGGRREEAFAAWRRFLEAIADERPLVLVFEDLHWADDALLDFVDYLVDWASGVPLLVLGTARPELLSRRPGWGGGKSNSSTILLSALSGDETAALLHALLGSSVVDADLQARLLEHAGGNPLYAEEFTRMLTSRPDDVVLPETVQGIIAARLDTLSAEEKELLQDAAAVGRTFWLGALGGERWRLEERLHALERNEFVRRERRSAVAGETEYSFRHALVREVAYEQIPRAQRADKHRAAAEWIESLGRIEDHSELLAHHYAAALDYARASGQDTDPWRSRDGSRSERRAIAPSRSTHSRQLRATTRSRSSPGRTTTRSGRSSSSSSPVRTARTVTSERSSRSRTPTRQRSLPGDSSWRPRRTHCSPSSGGTEPIRVRSSDHLERAFASVHDLPSSPGKAHVLSQVARYRMLGGADEEAIRIGEEALAMAEELGLVEVQAHALINIGTAKVNLGDASGLEDLERAIEIALAAGSSEVARAPNNLAVAVRIPGRPRRCLALLDEAVAHAERLGMANLLRFSQNVQLWVLFQVGAWDVALPPTDEFLAACDAGEPHYHEGGMRLAPGGRSAGARRRSMGRSTTCDKPSSSRGKPAIRSSAFPGSRVRTPARRGGRAGRRAARSPERLFEPSPLAWGLVDLAFVAQRARLCRGARRAARTRPADEVDRCVAGTAARATSSTPPTCSTRSATPSSRRSRAYGLHGSSPPKDAEPKPTSSSASLAFWRSRRRDALHPRGRGAARGRVLTDGGVQRPAVGNALELVLAALLEGDARAGHEIAHRARDEHLARSSKIGDARSDVYGDAGDIVASSSSPRRRERPLRTSSPLRASASRMCHAQRIPRAGPSNVASIPSPAVFVSSPAYSARPSRTVRSKRSSAMPQLWSPSSLARSVDPTTSMKSTVASTRSVSAIVALAPP